MLIEAGHASDARTNHDPAAYDTAKTPWTVGLVGAIAGVASAGVGVALLARAPGRVGSGQLDRLRLVGRWFEAGAFASGRW